MRNAIAIFTIVAIGFGCARRAQQQTATPATRPDASLSSGASGGTFTDKKAGIELSWPGGWKPKPGDECDLLIVSVPKPEHGENWISLDIPELPIHIPGMIPIGQVQIGYLDDLKKQFGKLEVTQLDPPGVLDSKERFVRASWETDGRKIQQTALLLVHGDRVYILRARCDVEVERQVRACFDSVIESIRWISAK